MSDHFQVAIIGAGPAGLAAAASAAHHKLSHVLFEKANLANTIYDYQKHKHVMAEPKKLPLRAHVGFEEGSREAILDVYEKRMKELAVNIRNAEVSAIKKTDNGFEVTYSGGKITAQYVILAIGCQGSPRKLGVPGEEQPHVAYTLSDPDEFKGMDILVVGAGDSAIENAVALSKHNSVSILNRSAEFARAKDGNVKLITAAIKANKIRCYSSAGVSKIEPEHVYIETPQGEVKVKCGRIIVRAGAILPRKFLEGCGISFPNEQPTALPVVDARYESNVKGLFILGALIGYPLIKHAMNQGYEVIEHILGNPVEPADQVLIDERLAHLPGTVKENYDLIRKSLPLFKDLSEPQFREMLIDSTVHLMEPGQTVFERLDYTDTFYSVVSGAAAVCLEDNRSLEIEPGNFFGEIGLISGRRRSATVKVARKAMLLETPRKQMLKLISSVEGVKRTLDEVFMLRALQTMIFPDAEPEFLQKLVKKARFKRFKKGEVLFKEGDIGDALYVIRKGSVKISRLDTGGVDVARTYIPAGNFVGEMALIDPAPLPRSATVTAAVACETILIDKADFIALLDENPTVKSRISRIADERRIENITAEADRKSGAVLDFMFKEGLTDAYNVLVIDSDLCVACDNCEAACAATHGGYSRLDRKGGKFFAAVQVPISCRHCENPLCMLDCPPDALTRKPDGEVVIRDSCIGCGNCVANCPYGVIQLVYEDTPFSLWTLLGLKKKEKGPAKAAKCDMCEKLDGGPACVRACPTGAAIRINPSELGEMMRRKGGMH